MNFKFQDRIGSDGENGEGRSENGKDRETEKLRDKDIEKRRKKSSIKGKERENDESELFYLEIPESVEGDSENDDKNSSCETSGDEKVKALREKYKGGR